MTKSFLSHRGISCFELNLDALPSDMEEFGQYIEALDVRQLERLTEGLVAEFDRTFGDDEGASLDKDGVEKVKRLSAQIKATRAETVARAEADAAQRAAEGAEQQRLALAELRGMVHAPAAVTATVELDDEPAPEPVADDATAEVTAAALVNAFQVAVRRLVPVENVIKGADLNQHVRGIPLGDIAKQAPTAKVFGPRTEPAQIVASTDAQGMPRMSGNRLAGIGPLVQLMSARARMLQVTHGDPVPVPIASLQRDFRYRLSLDSTPDEVNEVLTAATDVSALVAAGGWCAPSEISYDFFNLVCEDGMLDLPSVGVLNRGGFRYPTSASIADIFAASPNALWTWNETMDAAAATGTGMSGTKTCARVPCPAFNEVKAACDGLCVTVGNLIDFSYPELIANHIRLIMAARAHRTNQLVLAQLEAASEANTYGGATGQGTTAEVLNGLDLNAVDYRERYRMCEDAVLEAVFPRWFLGAIRSDLANRSGLLAFQVTSGQIADWLNSRSIRAQFVGDWQSGFSTDAIGHPTTEALNWPSTGKGLLYAPGTFVRGQGLQLDLGIVRDSTLNSTNDHTAAWLEDCYAVAKVGHESRVITFDTVASGAAGKALT